MQTHPLNQATRVAAGPHPQPVDAHPDAGVRRSRAGRGHAVAQQLQHAGIPPVGADVRQDGQVLEQPDAPAVRRFAGAHHAPVAALQPVGLHHAGGAVLHGRVDAPHVRHGPHVGHARQVLAHAQQRRAELGGGFQDAPAALQGRDEIAREDGGVEHARERRGRDQVVDALSFEVVQVCALQLVPGRVVVEGVEVSEEVVDERAAHVDAFVPQVVPRQGRQRPEARAHKGSRRVAQQQRLAAQVAAHGEQVGAEQQQDDVEALLRIDGGQGVALQAPQVLERLVLGVQEIAVHHAVVQELEQVHIVRAIDVVAHDVLHNVSVAHDAQGPEHDEQRDGLSQGRDRHGDGVPPGSSPVGARVNLELEAAREEDRGRVVALSLVGNAAQGGGVREGRVGRRGADEQPVGGVVFLADDDLLQPPHDEVGPRVQRVLARLPDGVAALPAQVAQHAAHHHGQVEQRHAQDALLGGLALAVGADHVISERQVGGHGAVICQVVPSALLRPGVRRAHKHLVPGASADPHRQVVGDRDADGVEGRNDAPHLGRHEPIIGCHLVLGEGRVAIMRIVPINQLESVHRCSLDRSSLVERGGKKNALFPLIQIYHRRRWTPNPQQTQRYKPRSQPTPLDAC